MNNPYDPQSWSKLYREEVLRETSRRHLVERANRNHGVHPRLRRVGFALNDVLGGLRW